MTSYPRFMLAAGSSGSGKTMITCGLLQALKNRGLQAASFKCGPDYIDPMFHEKVIHTKSRNLDTFFTDEETTRYLFARNAEGFDISVMEGVMGYYDGLGGISVQASAYDLARVTETPVVLILNTRGMSLSVLACLKGYLTYREPSGIRGVILNQMSGMLYPEIRDRIQEELGVTVYGYVPKLEDCALESRHLGLVLPDEVAQLEEKLQKIAGVLEETVEIDALLELAGKAPELDRTARIETHLRDLRKMAAVSKDEAPLRIAVSRDEAFCFIYEDNLQLLRDLGAELVPFSPIHDAHLPEGTEGLLLYGGYPELYAGSLSENYSMLREIRERLRGGLPCMAECGGFMYLHTGMEDMDGNRYPMADVIPGEAYRTKKLGRFGYIELEPVETEMEEESAKNVSLSAKDAESEKEETSAKAAGSGNDELPADSDQTGKSAPLAIGFNGKLRGHEFHYFDSTACGESFLARKPLRKRSWKCIHRTETMLAGFPHLYYYANPGIAAEFLQKCRRYRDMMS